ncbi:MAG: cytochrome b/b6 domain-containing protein [Hyphomicrobiales bacterium]|nr:cytochrome b/b6 domain-containing protein [Hyphomicrobiales bacterium]
MDQPVNSPAVKDIMDEAGARSVSVVAPPRTDVGTLTLHWVTALAFLVSLFTGVRIAADALHAPVSKWLSPILPQGEIWSWHFLAGLTLFFCASAYVIYLMRSGLSARNSLKKTRVLTLPAPAKMKWGAVNVALHWFLYALVAFLTGTGAILYIGYGGWWAYLHSTAAFIGLGYIFAHVLSHYLHGGWWQVFRVFRPQRLIRTRAVRPKPLLIALGVGALFAVLVAGLDWVTRDTLVIARVREGPKLESLLEDPVWARARPVFIHTQQGANLGGTGESLVEVRAVHDGEKVYFAFRWEDPTRSLRRIPLIKREDGWYPLDQNTGRQDAVDFYEDKIAVIFSDNPSLGGSGATALGPHPLPPDKPSPLNERGFHFTTDGSYISMWQWKASRGGLLGWVDNQFIGPPYEPTKDEASYDARYQGGYWNAPGRSSYSYNYKFIRKDHQGPATILRLPKDWKAQVAALGKYDLDPNSSDDESGRWYMFEQESEPYTPEADAKIPVGTVLPGVIISGEYEGERGVIRGAAKWKDGHWTLITARKLKSGGKYDKDFVPGHDLYMWVAVFDHTQTRHTVHSRAVRVTTQE